MLSEPPGSQHKRGNEYVPVPSLARVLVSMSVCGAVFEYILVYG